MLMKKFIGKPYAGKPHVRIDEGVGKVFLTFPLYSTAFFASFVVNGFLILKTHAASHSSS